MSRFSSETTEPAKRKGSSVSSVKLNFDNISFHGRANETITLHKALARVERQEGPEIVLIHGPSGCGKTTVAEVLRNEEEETNSERNQYFISGKFDSFASRPYSAFVDALSDLCEQVAESDDISKVRSSLNSSLGDEDAILRDALPKVERIIGQEFERSEPLYNENFAFERLKISFRALLRSVLKNGKTIVMFIDNLQWGDAESWKLMKNLASDVDMNRLLLVGAYRNDEMPPMALQNVSDLSNVCTVRDIELRDFEEEQLNELVASILKTSTEETKSLSSVIHAKSAGNPHFTIQFMKLAESRELISYSMDNFCWVWDTEKIKSDTDIGDNVVDIYVAKIDSLDTETKNALIFGSCLGAKFDALVVESVLTRMDMPSHTMSREQLTIALEQGLEEGFVDRLSGSSVYRFAHEKIHSAFYSLVTEIVEPDQLHLKIGQVLLQYWKGVEIKQNWLTYLAANQLNKGIHLVGHAEDRIELAELNLAAAKAAVSASAYGPASEYLQSGLRLIDDTGWEHYDLRLEMSVLFSRTEFCIGNFRSCHETVDEVIRNAHTAEEKIPVFRVCVDALGAEGRLDECIEKGTFFAKQLGVKLPKRFNKLTTVFAMMKTKKMLKGKTEVDLLNYAQAVDPSKLAAVRIINTLSSFAVHARQNELMATLVFINIQMILKHGFTDEAGSLLAYYGALLACVGDFDEGYKYGQIGVKLATKTNFGVTRTLMNYHITLDHLKNPLHQSLEPLLRGYRVAFEVGDTMFGFYCSFLYLSIFYFVGLPLKNLLRDAEAFGKEMEEYNTRPPLLLLKPYHQAVINLTTETPNPTVLNGTAMTEDEITGCGLPQALEGVWLAKLLLALYFNDYEVMRVNLNKLLYDRPPDGDGCMFHAIVMLWAQGLAAMQIARRTKQRKYKAIAYKRIKMLEKWTKNGNVNCHHFLLHLYAERAVWEKKPSAEVKRAYDLAISSSRRAGFTNTAALVNERCAMYFLEQRDKEWASLYMSTACELYDDWGATTKKKIMMRDHRRLLRLSEQSLAFVSGGLALRSTAFKGRKRHTSFLGNMHRGASMELVDANSSKGELSESFGESFFASDGQIQMDTGAGNASDGNIRSSEGIRRNTSTVSPGRRAVAVSEELSGSTGELVFEDQFSSIARESALNVRIEEVEIL